MGPQRPLKAYSDITIKEKSLSLVINVLVPHTKLAAITMPLYFSTFF